MNNNVKEYIKLKIKSLIKDFRKYKKGNINLIERKMNEIAEEDSNSIYIRKNEIQAYEVTINNLNFNLCSLAAENVIFTKSNRILFYHYLIDYCKYKIQNDRIQITDFIYLNLKTKKIEFDQNVIEIIGKKYPYIIYDDISKKLILINFSKTNEKIIREIEENILECKVEETDEKFIAFKLTKSIEENKYNNNNTNYFLILNENKLIQYSKYFHINQNIQSENNIIIVSDTADHYNVKAYLYNSDHDTLEVIDISNDIIYTRKGYSFAVERIITSSVDIHINHFKYNKYNISKNIIFIPKKYIEKINFVKNKEYAVLIINNFVYLIFSEFEDKLLNKPSLKEAEKFIINNAKKIIKEDIMIKVKM